MPGGRDRFGFTPNGSLETGNRIRDSRFMTSPESRRHDLYNGLVETLGVKRADVLMTYLPSTESTQLATKADFRALESRIGTVESNLTTRTDSLESNLSTRIDSVGSSLSTRIDSVESNLTARIDALGIRLDQLATRIDRIVLAVVAALVVIIARTFF